jgi:hypothetical protein
MNHMFRTTDSHRQRDHDERARIEHGLRNQLPARIALIEESVHDPTQKQPKGERDG